MHSCFVDKTFKLLNWIWILFCIQSSYNLFIDSPIEAIIHLQDRNKTKVHRFTNNLQGLQKVMVKDFSWNIISWNASLFEKTLKQWSILDTENYGFILNTCHDTAKRAVTRDGTPVIFSRLRWPIEPKFSQVCYFICKLWHTKYGPLDNTVYRKCPMALKTIFRLYQVQLAIYDFKVQNKKNH